MTISFSNVMIHEEGITTSEFGRLQIRLTQKTVKTYGGKKYTNSLSENLFDDDELDQSGEEFTADRNYWMLIDENKTVEMIQERIAKFPNAMIQRSLYSAPEFSEEQLAAIASGKLTQEAVAERQLVVYPDDHEAAGQPVLHEGQHYYHRYDFRRDAVEDLDFRISTPADVIIEA